jgi:hypothetical protein
MTRYGTTRSSYGRESHPGSLVGNRAEVEAHRVYVLDGNGTDDDPEPYTDDNSDGWVIVD